jgi:hypothetical protein
MPPADKHVEGIVVHGEEREPYGCARHAPAGLGRRITSNCFYPEMLS